MFYNGEHLDNQLFEKQFLDALRDSIEKPNEPDSPVLEALGGRGTLYSIVYQDENKRKVAALKLEFSFNSKLLEKIYSSCDQNKAFRRQKKDAKCRMTTSLLMYSGIENLNTNRYLDLDPQFYDALFDYHMRISAINKNLVDWPKSARYNEKRMLNYKKHFEEDTRIIQLYLEKLL